MNKVEEVKVGPTIRLSLFDGSVQKDPSLMPVTKEYLTGLTGQFKVDLGRTVKPVKVGSDVGASRL